MGKKYKDGIFTQRGDVREYRESAQIEIQEILGGPADQLFASVGCCETCIMGVTQSLFEDHDCDMELMVRVVNGSGWLHFLTCQIRAVSCSFNPKFWWLVENCTKDRLVKEVMNIFFVQTAPSFPGLTPQVLELKGAHTGCDSLRGVKKTTSHRQFIFPCRSANGPQLLH